MSDPKAHNDNRRVTRARRRTLDIMEANDIEQALVESALIARPSSPGPSAAIDPPPGPPAATASSASSTATVNTVVTIDPSHLQHNPIPALPTSLPASVPAARGFIFAAGQSASRTAMFRFNDGVYVPFGDRMIPDVRVGQLFRVPPNTAIHRAFIVSSGRCFLAYGFTVPTFPRNDLIWALKHTTVWRGDVVVFQVGLRVNKPLLRSPRVRRTVADTVVSIFVSRVTEFLDLGLPVPTIIEA